jgi:hypothetical protein
VSGAKNFPMSQHGDLKKGVNSAEVQIDGVRSA